MLNIAIIGTGNIARLHIEGYRTFPERAKITALVDIYPEKAEAAKKTYGLTGAAVYASHKDILDDPAIDLVSICTPPYCHAEIAVDCLLAGKNVIVEKPMAASLEECDAMLDAAKKSGMVFSVIAQNRFRAPIAKLRAVLDSGLIGRVVHAQIDSFWWRGHSYYDLWWRGTWEKEGGGCTLNHAVHHIDMLVWMMGLPNTVTAVISNANHDNSEVEDISVAVLGYDKGALAQVTSSVIHHGEEQQLIFQGEHARISAPWKVKAHLAKENGFPTDVDNLELEKKLDDLYNGLPEPKYIAHTGQLDNVMSVIEAGGGTPLITGEQGRMTIELITAIYKAGTGKRMVELPVKKDDAFYTVEGIMKSVPHFYEKGASVLSLDGAITAGNNYTDRYGYDGKK